MNRMMSLFATIATVSLCASIVPAHVAPPASGPVRANRLMAHKGKKNRKALAWSLTNGGAAAL